MTKDFDCPHCGEDYSIDENETYHLYSTNDIEEIVCAKCENSFFVKVHTRFSFETETKLQNF